MIVKQVDINQSIADVSLMLHHYIEEGVKGEKVGKG